MIEASWPAPPGVRAFTTTREGGVSLPPYDSLNLGAFVGDLPERVAENRRRAWDGLGWSEPLWLKQVHGTRVVVAEQETGVPEADGAMTESPRPLAVLTADCLPVALCDRAGTVVGLVHAGWRGLLNGVIETALAALHRPGAELLAWIGPAIGPASYQVADDVRDAFLVDPEHEADFAEDGPGHWRFDLPGAASRKLRRAGVAVYGGDIDTFRDQRFFSHRRQAPSGRMATFICLESRR